MAKSIFHDFLLNMWIMRKADEVYLQARVQKMQITQAEYEKIISTQKVD